ncbi:N-acetylglucosamine kinase-like BadF-type ATPase [Kitasatospora sp. SolWspMP-SS2h]|uniref:N-acetylglucosamine kinase n=1 Tax=Kitasatospora sp. SolWspMP-SS2h TaxID=1305729 RepID=UPI000DBFDF58|nr:BadF/BadG/BcrA/BcrD ATPase family protein [Kitasatospora sp. SolWspMP-SS2h]RAJ35346.1 N-acetylglucosamine kinase-like BadF-type ATPase [Kitasatospora sp. SolWspMP-SS2h]
MAGARLVLGLDVGGTSTRVLVADLDGRVLGAARGAGGNPVAHGAEAAAKEIGDTVRAALAGLDPARVAAGVLGLAGGLVARPAFGGLWDALGLGAHPVLVSDVLLAHAAGTSAPDGHVVLSGTGGMAAEVRGHELTRTADGHGWLLGDRGSGVWLGREAVSATLTALDRDEPLTGLAAAVAGELTGPDGLDGPDGPDGPDRSDRSDRAEGRDGSGPGDDLRSALITAVHGQAPTRLARLAPVVLERAGAGDPTALALVARAADHLLDTLGLLRAPGCALPIVLAGGLLSTPTPLAARLRPLLAARWPDVPLRPAGNGAGAAAWLAARSLGRGTEELHRALTA